MASPVIDRKRSFEEPQPRKTDSPQVKDRQASPKRKSTEGNGTVENGDSGKKKRRKVNHACVYCRRSHMTCDLQRPCARCVKRDIGHLCHDEPRDPPKRSKSEVGVTEIAPAPDSTEPKDGLAGTNGHVSFATQQNGDLGLGPGEPGSGTPHLVQPTPLSPNTVNRASGENMNANSVVNFDWNNNGVQNQFQDMHHLHPNFLFNTSEVTNEYNLLNDFLSTSLLDDGALYNNDDAQVFLNDPLLSTNAMASSFANPHNKSGQPAPTLAPSQTQAGNEIVRPSSTFPVDPRAQDKFYMVAADPAGLSSAEDRLHKLLRAKYDAGMLKPFNYVKGYARLNSYMEKHISRESRVRILRQLERFRPKFREAMQSLTDMQLVLVEMWFERSLMEYDRVFASMAIPACCWRRTGEIYRGNKEMAELINVPIDKLRDGKLAIHDIIAENSLVSYWEKFGAIAFDQSQKAILTSCALKNPSDEKSDPGLRCCFSFTIRRDTHNIPSLIVGNFIPIRPRKPSQ